jgi:hypothetical protein
MTIQSLTNTSTRFRALFIGCTLMFAFAMHSVTIAVQGRLSKTETIAPTIAQSKVSSETKSDSGFAALQNQLAALSDKTDLLQRELAATKANGSNLVSGASSAAIQEAGLGRLKIKEHIILIGSSEHPNWGGEQEIRYDSNGGKIPETFLANKDGEVLEFGQRIIGAWYNLNGQPQNMRDMNYVGLRVFGNKVKWFCNNNKPVGPYLVKVFVLYVE